MFEFEGRVALVTGGSRGLGREMATALSEQGAIVVICSRNGEEVQDTAARISAETGGRVLGVAADVSQRADIESLADMTFAEFRRIDILINNAGAGFRKPILEMEDDQWDQVLRVCLTAPMMLARAVVPHMIEARYGRVINISSSLGSIAFPERGPYCSAKGALLQLTKVMALEWAPHGVTVNAICPGPFRTSHNLKMEENPALYESYLKLIPQHRWGEPKEIRAAAVYLASEEASFVTGSTVYVDGGWTSHAGLPETTIHDPRAIGGSFKKS
jgi:NAD(P)-dependent dehydrogenase (short-subunit alcohol dehydrogenase family)